MAHPKRKWSKARTSRHRSLWKRSVIRRCFAAQFARTADILMVELL